MNFSSVKNIYMIGIKGVGMTMLAQFLQAKDFNVSGSDVNKSFPSEKSLKRAKIKYHSGFSLDNIPEKIDLLIYSSAYSPKNNIELAYCQKNKVKTISYIEALAYFFNKYQGWAVCGSHGKTTVSSWWGHLLYQAGYQVNVLSGSYTPQFKGSALISPAPKIIIEADEYQNKLKYLKPQGVLLNNINFDHPDYFKNEQDYYQVFLDFVKKIPRNGFLIANFDDPLVRDLALSNKGETIFYGLSDWTFFSEFAKFKKNKYYQAKNIQRRQSGQSFSLFLNNRNLGIFQSKLVGDYNISNALAVLSASRHLGLTWPQIKKDLASFRGVSRRFEFLGKFQGALLFDDYAHHPTEIKAVLKTLRETYPNNKIITVFHPHTFSRSKALADDFALSFTESDELYFLEIYASAREKNKNFSSRDLIEKIKNHNHKINKKQKITYLADIETAKKQLPRKIKAGDLVLFLGAGDVFRIPYSWLGL